MPVGDPYKVTGPVAWMARNPIASNLFMAVLIFGGLIGVFRTKQEVLPEFEIDIVLIQVAYPGASPSEIEQGIVLSIEDAVNSVDGVKRVSSTSSEGFGSVLVEILLDAEPGQVLSDTKAAVDRISSFPQDAEEPTAKLLSLRKEVVSLILSGDQEIATLHAIAEEARAELRSIPGITQVDIAGVPPRELSIEISRQMLESHGLTLDDVARQVSAASLELPGGSIKTTGGELLVRLSDRKQTASDFAGIIIRSTADREDLRLGEIATITDGYEDNDQASYYNGKRAVRINCYRVGSETPTAVADSVKAYAETLRSDLPPSIGVSVWQDQSELLKGRIDLLLNNAKLGLVLVFIALALFIEIRLAFWVAMGIPICFLGSFLLLPQTGATINMVSLFAYIVTLGIVVDDAIIVGESIYSEAQKGKDWLRAAIDGSKLMVVPVTFAVLTTIAAFSPLLVVPGVSGKFFKLIPTVVICVLLLSLVESFFILPAHLAFLKKDKKGWLMRVADAPRRWLSSRLESFTEGRFSSVVSFAIRNRYSTLAAAMACFLLSIGLVGSGQVPFSFFPKLEGELVTASAKLPFGTPSDRTRDVASIVEKAAEDAVAAAGGAVSISTGMLSSLGEGPEGRGGAKEQGGHLATIQVSLVPSDLRTLSSEEFSALWLEKLPSIPGLESLTFSSSAGPGGASAPIDIKVASNDLQALEKVSSELSDILRRYPSLRDVENSYSSGKQQLDFQLRPEARSLGLTSSDVARQLRGAFYGTEAFREQVGRLERKTMVRLPREQRETESDLQNFRVRTPQGSFVPLAQVADFSRGQAPTSISREEGVRKVNVSARLAAGVKSGQEVLSDLKKDVLPGFEKKYGSVSFSFSGEQRDQGETFASLGPNYLLALFAIYALLAIPFRSYVQPLIIMSAIPFGFVGAIIGHMLLGYELSIMSMFGVIALTGVVVNDSLVLLDATNRYRSEGATPMDAVLRGAKRRLRPIILTSLTTFLGLAPMIAETSVQARFLVPMAISLGFGIIFATVIILLVVPSLYIIQEDILGFFRAPPESADAEALAEAK
jgi:multidrug efflux pump subunit AcrB